jgi:hypothetical protein
MTLEELAQWYRIAEANYNNNPSFENLQAKNKIENQMLAATKIK